MISGDKKDKIIKDDRMISDDKKDKMISDDRNGIRKRELVWNIY